MLFTHTPFLTMTKPMTDLIASEIWQIRYTGMIARPVKRVSRNERGTTMQSIKKPSNRNVISVFPPERKVKYAAFV